MEDIIKLNSRVGENNYLKKLKKADNSESKTYILKSDIATVRSGYTDNHCKYIVPFGGPTLTEGLILKEAQAIVESINYMYGIGYIIIFK